MDRRELVEKMLDASGRKDSWRTYCEADKSMFRAEMDLALGVAIDELLQSASPNETWEWHTKLEIEELAVVRTIAFYTANRRAKLERVKTPEERVTVVSKGTLWGIGQDEKWLGVTFAQKEHAEIYRRGLIETLKEKN